MNQLPYKNPSLSPDQRADDLLSRMNLAEQWAQLRTIGNPGDCNDLPGHVFGFCFSQFDRMAAGENARAFNDLQARCIARSRWQIPLILQNECIAGIKNSWATVFPQPITQASSWDPDLVERVHAAIAREGLSRGTRQVLGPVLNVLHDQRWGRAQETFGENPYLCTVMGVAAVRAYESQGIVSTLKHLAWNDGMAGHNSGSVDISERALRVREFPPYEAAVREGRSLGVMAAYNSIDGVPCHSNRWLLETILRQEWGFEGIVISDGAGMPWLCGTHRVAPDLAAAGIACLRAGCDTEITTPNCINEELLTCAESDPVLAGVLKKACRRVLYVKFRIGLFEKPYADVAQTIALNACPAHRALARESAAAGCVLLKNNQNALPLSPTIRKLAVLGPTACTPVLGRYAPWDTPIVDLCAGLRAALPHTEVVTSPGAEIARFPAVAGAWFQTVDGQPGLHAEYFSNANLEGAAVVVRRDPAIAFDWDLGGPTPEMPVDHFSARWTGLLSVPQSGLVRFAVIADFGVRLWIDDTLLIDGWNGGTFHSAAMMLDSSKQHGLRLEYRALTWFASVTLGWDADVARLVPEALGVAAGADAVIVSVGAVEEEGADRAHVELTSGQEALINAVAATRVPVCVVINGASSLAMAGWIDSVDAVVYAGYPGCEGGAGIADVLTGAVTPGGKLPVTQVRFTGQAPLTHGHQCGGHAGFVDEEGTPQFPFGHGLSYTSFALASPRLCCESITPDQSIALTVDVRNTGTCRGSEVVQVYLQDSMGSVTPVHDRLIGLRKVQLEPGEVAAVRFEFGPTDLALLGQDLRKVVEPGEMVLLVGTSSADIRHAVRFIIEAPV